jgi:hypothetical protein
MNKKIETIFGKQTAEAKALPFINMMPQSYAGMLQWRLYVRERASRDREFRETILQMCAQDVAFFGYTFAVFHETRETEDIVGKFPAWLDPDQIDILACFQAYGGKTDLTVDKTRGIGLSYLACLYLLWRWKFNENSIDMGLLTRNEKALDQRDRPGSLMGKLDLLFKELPYWMRNDKYGKTILYRTSSNQNRKFNNRANGNTITGYLPTNDDLRSDRLAILVADEAAFLNLEDQKWLASAYGTVNSVLWISTLQGSANLFYRLTQDDESRLVRISTYWWNNRRCRRGMYKVVNGRVEVLDPDYYRDKPGYFTQPFIHKLEAHIQGRVRSPWTDNYFTRAGVDPSTMLEELYGILALESRKLLRPSVIKSMQRSSRGPMAKGYLREGEWVDDPEGPIWLWCNPARPVGLCTIGVDPALTEHSGAYFAAAGLNFKTGEQVFSYRSRQVSADRFPAIITEIGNWLSAGGARPKIAFESQGPAGAIFAAGVLRLRYPALGQEEGKAKPGYGNNDRGASVLVELGRACREGEAFLRDERIAIDSEAYEFDKDWELTFAGRDGHGDLAIATAFAWHEAKKKRIAYLRAQARQVDYDPDEEKYLRRRASRVWSDRFKRSA